MFTRSLKSLALSGSALCLAASLAQADQVFLDDIIVDGSACIGMDCVNGESFGFDTIRIKENNLRIKAVDTSSTASFPTTDWQLTFNDSSNGGQNRFSVEDVTAGRVPFTIEGAAPSHALYVDDGGRIGLGTSTPVVEAHIKDGDTPTVRLEQDGSSGFTPQSWDLAGNETNFFVRDVTNGSTLPFRVRPGAPTSAIDIAADGNIGIGNSSPKAPLHVLVAGTSAEQNANDDFIVQDTGPARMVLVNTSATNAAWTLNSNNTFRISTGADSPEFVLRENGNMDLEGTCIEFNANNTGSNFACTFTAGGGAVCAAAPSTC